MILKPELLDAKISADPLAFAATSHAHGLYSTNQFVLRLSPVVHRTLASFDGGVKTNQEIGLEGAQAMSTYLHETIHWWQHIGSTYGFIFGIIYPVQTHAAFNHLKTMISDGGFHKSILKQSEGLNLRGPTGPGTLAGTANIIVNDHFDMESFRRFTLGPEAASVLVADPRFEAAGHAFHMTYARTIGVLASSVDENFAALPDFRSWHEGFSRLREAKTDGHVYGTRIEFWPVGSREIFEGQARFSQIQYLSHACGHNLDWAAYAALGLLDGIYIKAFREFLRLTESGWPTRVDDPLVSLFLLVCDLAINPSSGFPITVEPNFLTFVEDVQPGARFTIFSRFVAQSFPTMKGAIRRHSRQEYAELTQELSSAYNDVPPLLASQVCASWFSSNGPLAHLRQEFTTYNFDPKNYVIRHLFSHFLAFQEDRLRTPEFFCWPGPHMAGENLTLQSEVLFEKHGALFVDKEDDDSVFPRLQRGRTAVIVDEAFHKFYGGNVVYDLVRQWINEPGPFTYNLNWLKANSDREEQKGFVKSHFQSAFGVDPDDAKILAE